MNKALIAAALPLAALVVVPEKAEAGFYMEGLAPYTTVYCDGQDGGVTDPFIAPPASIWNETSPDASTMGGRAPWDAEDCVAGKWTGMSGKASRVHSLGKSPSPVPQK